MTLHLHKISLIFLFYAIALSLSAQQVNQVLKTSDKNIRYGSILYELPPAPPQTKGSHYLDETWRQGNVTLSSNSSIKAYPIRLNLESRNLEIKADKDIKVVGFHMIKQFTWSTGHSDSAKFINTKYFYDSSNQDSKILQVLVLSKFGLFKHSEKYLEKPNYNVALDVGHRDPIIKTRENYYLLKDSKLFKLNSKLKKNKELLGKHYTKVFEFSKRHHLKFSKEDDLMQIIEFLNGA